MFQSYKGFNENHKAENWAARNFISFIVAEPNESRKPLKNFSNKFHSFSLNYLRFQSSKKQTLLFKHKAQKSIEEWEHKMSAYQRAFAPESLWLLKNFPSTTSKDAQPHNSE